MKKRIRFLPLSAAVLAITLVTLRAQVPDGSSATYNNTTNTFANITIGTNGSFTLLTLANNALFNNSGNGVIGLNATARSNEVRLMSPTARWFLGNDLFVGSNGSFNRLVVSNGGTVRSHNGFLGPYVPGSNNFAVVTGSGSTWSNSNVFYLGFNGAGNQLIVSNGGILRADGSLAGVNTTSSNNIAVVTGIGSLWSNTASLQFGYGGSGNQLVISNGGVMRSSLGLLGGGVSASNTAVTITGSGSLWSNTTDLYVGQSAVGNQLVVRDGGAVRNGHGYIGANFTGSNNLALITGGESVWSNALDLDIGAYSGNNQLIVSNGGTVFAAGRAVIGPTLGGDGNAATVTGFGTRWLVGDDLYLGSNGALSRLIITNGGRMANSLGRIGQNISSSNNVAVVTGTGSVWSNVFTLYLGYSGRSNQLLVTDGGAVRDSLSYVGMDFTSSSNLAVVTEPGSVWSNAFELYFGFSGAGNQLTVSNGGAVFCSIGTVGFNTASSNNLALVTGPGSMWSNTYEFYFGFSGAGNRLAISDGSALWNTFGNVGYMATSSNNVVSITGAGSRWTNSQNLIIGNSGSRNQLVVSNGATVFTGGIGFLGYGTGANSSSSIVTDAGTRWLLSSNLYVGSNGALSRLVISNGAMVVNAVGTLGQNASSSNNLAVVTGAGSVWSNSISAFVGFNGPGNQLVISNGAVVGTPGESTIGFNSSAISNLASVIDPGTTWRVGGNFAVGDNSAFNRLIVTNGGQVLCPANGLIGFNSGGRSNLALVTGSGSLWSNGGSVFVGYSGMGNRLVVSNGAVVSDGSGFVGLASSSNLAVVTGSGSLWRSSSTVFVGYFNGDNQLVVSNGGEVFSGQGTIIGFDPNSLRNRVTVDGGSLRGTNVIGNCYLDVLSGTNVLNSGLIEVNRLLLTNALGWFEFNGGALMTSGTTNSNGRVFTVGNGTSAANFQLRGGTHSFANGLSIANNGSLTGSGTVLASVNVLPGGTLSPGTSIGKLILNNSPILQGATIMEIGRNGSALTNDQIQVAGTITYAGSLTVTNIGPTALAAGDCFQLFSAGNYAGAFSPISLPLLGFNLSWTNKLAVDGSIEVVGGPIPQFTGISKSGTNIILTGTGGIANTTYVVLTATNAAQSVSEWTSIATNQFGSGGSFSFTNGIDPGTPQRFFRLRWP